MRCPCGTEVSIRSVHVDVRVVSPVENVEKFKPDLEVDAFSDGCVLVEIRVRLEEIRAAELHRLLVTPLAKRRNGEIRYRYGTS